MVILMTEALKITMVPDARTGQVKWRRDGGEMVESKTDPLA